MVGSLFALQGLPEGRHVGGMSPIRGTRGLGVECRGTPALAPHVAAVASASRGGKELHAATGSFFRQLSGTRGSLHPGESRDFRPLQILFFILFIIYYLL